MSEREFNFTPFLYKTLLWSNSPFMRKLVFFIFFVPFLKIGITLYGWRCIKSDYTHQKGNWILHLFYSWHFFIWIPVYEILSFLFVFYFLFTLAVSPSQEGSRHTRERQKKGGYNLCSSWLWTRGPGKVGWQCRGAHSTHAHPATTTCIT